MRRSLTIALTLGLALQAVPVAAVAQDAVGDEPLIAPAADDIVGWTDFTERSSTIRWKIDSEGTLIIEPLSGTTGVLEYSGTPPWHSNASSIRSFRVSDGCTIECHGLLGGMFLDCSSLTSLDLTHLDTSQVTDMRSMFNGCSSLTSLNVSSLKTSQVTDMGLMFNGCSSLTSLDLSSFDTSQVTDMYCMFENCSSLASLSVSSFNTAQVKTMRALFGGCSSLTSLDLSSFDTSQSEDNLQMFSGDESLRQVKLGEKFVFKAGNRSATLPTPQGDSYTGNWVRVASDGSYIEPACSSYDLRDNWTPELAGTWVWEKAEAPEPEPVTIAFASGKEGATGSMAGATVADGEDYAIPEPGFSLDGYTVSGWKASGTDADGNAIEGSDFALGATIAAGTFPAGSKVTLTAVWAEVPKPDPEPQPQPQPTPKPTPTPTPTKPTTTTKTTTAKPATTTAKKASTPARTTAPVLPKTGDPSVVASGLATGGLAALAAGLHRRRKRS